jgi:hypothetical protein
MVGKSTMTDGIRCRRWWGDEPFPLYHQELLAASLHNRDISMFYLSIMWMKEVDTKNDVDGEFQFAGLLVLPKRGLFSSLLLMLMCAATCSKLHRKALCGVSPSTYSSVASSSRRIQGGF